MMTATEIQEYESQVLNELRSRCLGWPRLDRGLREASLHGKYPSTSIAFVAHYPDGAHRAFDLPIWDAGWGNEPREEEPPLTPGELAHEIHVWLVEST